MNWKIDLPDGIEETRFLAGQAVKIMAADVAGKLRDCENWAELHHVINQKKPFTEEMKNKIMEEINNETENKTASK